MIKVSRRENHVGTVRFIMAPSNTGKSYWVKHSSPRGVADGDAVITRACGWPTQKGWYHDKRVDDVVQRENFVALCAHAVATGEVVVFNGRLFPRRSMIVAVVVITEELRARNARDRDRTSYGHTRDEFERNAKALIKNAMDVTSREGSRYLGVFQDLDTALAAMPDVKVDPLTPFVKSIREV